MKKWGVWSSMAELRSARINCITQSMLTRHPKIKHIFGLSRRWQSRQGSRNGDGSQDSKLTKGKSCMSQNL
jgi:hypothetical protein